MISASADNTEVLTCRCKIPKDSVFLRGPLIACRPTIPDLSINYSTPMDFSKRVIIKSAEAGSSMIPIFSQRKYLATPSAITKHMLDDSLDFARQYTLDGKSRRFSSKIFGGASSSD